MNYGRGQYRPMPKDFEAHAGESYPALTKRYHACTATINRWKALCGTNIPKERPVIGRDDMGRERSFPSISEAARQTPGAKPAPI